MHILKNFDRWWTDKYDGYLMYRRKQGLLSDVKKRHSQIVLTKDQKSEIDSFYLENYGAKIPYYWHEWFMSFTGNFDRQYFPSSLYFSEFEHYQNNKGEYVGVLQNKDFLNYVVRGMDVYSPKTILSCTDGVQYSEHSMQHHCLNGISDIGRIFIKPAIDSCQGKGCMMLDVRGGVDQISGRNIKDILYGYKNNFIVQECIETSEAVSRLHSSSVNTFRIATYRWKNQFHHCPVVMRIGRGGER